MNKINNYELNKIWKEYNEILNKISNVIGGTNNIVGEFAEKIISLFYNGNQAIASQKSYDVITNDKKRIQIKSRRVNNLNPTQLSVIRSWDFDLLVVILFSFDGEILKAIEIKCSEAKNFAKENKHQNGWVITTNNQFLNGKNSKDITVELKSFLNS